VTDYLDLPDGRRLAYCHTPGDLPGILFCPGFNSDMCGDKAVFLERWATAAGRQFTRFDYSGHGQSGGRFVDGSIGRWRDDALAVLDQVTRGPQVVVGSSMGGWIMLLLALQRADRLAGLVGIAAAPDFTRRLAASLDDAQRRSLQEQGFFLKSSAYGDAYPVGRTLLDEAGNHLLLDHAIDLDLPVRLLHGQADPDVPWQQALTLADKLSGGDVEVQLVKSGDHRLSSAADLHRLQVTLESLLAGTAGSTLHEADYVHGH
jgi:pimeloyl-ACP methyl ester carboxylesterase